MMSAATRVMVEVMRLSLTANQTSLRPSVNASTQCCGPA